MRCSVARVLTLLVCGVLVATGIGWCPENVLAASSNDTSFTWGNYVNGVPGGGTNNDFMPPLKTQVAADCWAFGATAVVESWYKITRDDTTNVWCCAALNGGGTSDRTGLSEDTLFYWKGAGTAAGGGSPATALQFVAGNPNSYVNSGILTRQDLPYDGIDYGGGTATWVLPSADYNRRLFLGGTIASTVGTSTEALQSAMLANGPLAFCWNQHCRAAYGWDDYRNDGYGNIGGIMAKDSSGGQWDWLRYFDVADGSASVACYAAKGAYFNGFLNGQTWNGGTGAWNTSTANWSPSYSGQTWAIGNGNTWLNGETKAAFGGTGGTVTIGANNMSTYGITVSSTGYVFHSNGGKLIVSGFHNDPTVTGGGINANQSVTFDSTTKLVVGAPSTWTTGSAGVNLTLNGPLNLNISTLTVDGPGNTYFNGVVSDVTDVAAHPEFNGLLTGYTGSLIKTGTGTLTLGAGTNTFSGNATLNNGTLAFSSQYALNNASLFLNGGSLALSGGAASALNLGALTKNDATAWTVAQPITVLHGVNVNGGTLTLGTSLTSKVTLGNAPFVIGNGSMAILDDTGLALGGPIRIVDNSSSGEVINAGELAFKGSNYSAGDAQTLKKLQIGGPATISVIPASMHKATLSVANDITAIRTIGSSILMRGSGLGSSTLPTNAHVMLTNGITLSGTTTNQVNTPRVFIMPYAIGDTSNTGGGTSLVTYDTTNGVRPLNTANEYVNNSVTGGTASNIMLTSNTSGTSTGNYHQLSLSFSGSSAVGLSVGTGTLTLDSAAIMNAGTGAHTISGGALVFNHNTATQFGLASSVGEGFIHTAANSNLTISSVIRNFGTGMQYNTELVKDGPGTLTLSGSNTYSGNTLLNAGTLVLAAGSNSVGTSVILLNGGTLSSSGSGVTVGGITAGLGPHAIAPAGAGTIGTLNCGGLTINSNSTLSFDINTSTPAWDEIDMTGGFAFAAGDTGHAKIQINKIAGSWTQGNTYDLLDFVSTTVDPITEFSLIGAPANSYLEFNNPTTPTQLWLYVGSSGAGPQLQGVPEPSTLALLGTGLVGLLVYAWRKRRQAM